MDLTIAIAGVIVFAVIMYVVMDGFDLGIGILFPFAGTEADRDRMMNSVAPIWDGNETWLVLGGVVLFAAFPRAYGVLLPALYLPVMVMLFGLVFRGVAFEFRFKAAQRAPWNFAFAFGSTIAAFAQGVVLGAYIDSFSSAGLERAGTLDWLSWFSLVTGAALVVGYALLGATWLVMKTEGSLQRWAFRAAMPACLLVCVFIAIVSLWTAFLNPQISARWFRWPNIAYLWIVPFVTGLVCLKLLDSVRRGDERLPFVLAVAIFLLCYAGLGISLWPIIIPPNISIWDAAASGASQTFLGAGLAVILPITLGYIAYSYYVFRGKVADESGYH
jgi:cytochrome bd ubiquinol oxidase subunit II